MGEVKDTAALARRAQLSESVVPAERQHVVPGIDFEHLPQVPATGQGSGKAALVRHRGGEGPAHVTEALDGWVGIRMDGWMGYLKTMGQ